MQEAVQDAGFNASSSHAEGRRARALLDESRERVAALLGASRKEIVFTAGGTEADNAAILGAVRAAGRAGRVVGTAIEHHAVLHAIEALATEGFATELLPVGPDGEVDPERFAAAVRNGAILASVAYANNELGTIAPVAELARLARDSGTLFHTDAVQAAVWLPIDAHALGVDLLCLSGHKFGGPKGVGVLYVRDGVPLAPILHGGGQEFGRRSGTENLLGIAGLARALEAAAADRAERAERVRGLRDRLQAGILATISEVRVNGGAAERLPNILNAGFAGLASEELLVRLDLEGVAVSAGSACASGALEPSHVIAALGLEPRWQRGTIRFSLGSATTAAEIEAVLALLPRVVAELRGNTDSRP